MRSSTLYSTGIGSGSTSRPSTSTVGEPSTRYDSSVRVGLDLDDLDLGRYPRFVDHALDHDERHSDARESSRARISIRTDPLGLRSRHVGPPPKGERRFSLPLADAKPKRGTRNPSNE